MINRLNDYAFKRIFGDPANKDILLDFLNSIILTDVTGLSLDEVKALGVQSVQERPAKFGANKPAAAKPHRSKKPRKALT